MANETPGKRQIAHKITISDLNEGKYVKEEGWEPNYVAISDGRKVSRVNILAIVVSKTEDSADYRGLIIDDGSGKINVRAFGAETDFSAFSIGDMVMIIGRPREFNNQKYIVPEIIKKMENRKWIDVRKLELQIVRKKFSGVQFEKVRKNDFEEEVVGEHEMVESKDETTADVENPFPLVIGLIKAMDRGDGADIAEICIKSKLDNAEEIIMDLLKEGEIFEVRPGRVKILS